MSRVVHVFERRIVGQAVPERGVFPGQSDEGLAQETRRGFEGKFRA